MPERDTQMPKKSRRASGRAKRKGRASPRKPPPPDAAVGPVKYKKPTGKPEDHPLERLHKISQA
jgi:hypothetical protein